MKRLVADRFSAASKLNVLAESAYLSAIKPCAETFHPSGFVFPSSHLIHQYPMAQSELESLRYEVSESVAQITFLAENEPLSLNYAVVAELREVLEAAESDPNVRVILLESEGKDFCLGYDPQYLYKLQSFGPDENQADALFWAEALTRLLRGKKPSVVAAKGLIQNEAVALLSVCDFAWLAQDAELHLTDATQGTVPALTTFFLTQRLGQAHARHMLLAARPYSSLEAKQSGLAYELCPASEVNRNARDFARRIAKANCPGAVELTKRLLGDLPAMAAAEGTKFAARMQSHTRDTHEYRRGLAARLNGEEVDWTEA
jgi:methylglutaconyl-CoA hydratase